MPRFKSLAALSVTQQRGEWGGGGVSRPHARKGSLEVFTLKEKTKYVTTAIIKTKTKTIKTQNLSTVTTYPCLQSLTKITATFLRTSAGL